LDFRSPDENSIKLHKPEKRTGEIVNERRMARLSLAPEDTVGKGKKNGKKGHR